MPELVLSFENRAALMDEYAKNLSHGRAFVAGADGLPVFSACTLTLEHPDTQRKQSFACEVVMVFEQGEGRGTALQFVDRSESNLDRLRSFVEETARASRALATPFDDEESTGVQERHDAMHAPADPDDYDELDEQTNPFGASSADEHEGNPGQRAIVAARAAKLQNLTPQQRMQVARSSVQEERVLLERIYGSAVWELLLRNPKITVPEVARMARKGTVPRPLLDMIAENEQWVRHALVRRALLANPRLSVEAVTKVLRTLPPRELKLVPQQTAYPPAVRQAATRLMRGT